MVHLKLSKFYGNLYCYQASALDNQKQSLRPVSAPLESSEVLYEGAEQLPAALEEALLF